MDILIILIYIFLGISVLSEIAAFAYIAFRARGSEEEVYWALAAEDETEFIQRMRSRLDKESKTKSFPIPDNTLPQNDEEFYSFFHYIYLPLFSELQKRMESLNRKNVSSRLVFYALTLILVPTLHILGEGLQIILLAVSLLAVAVTLTINYIYKQGWKKSSLLMQELDNKFAAFNQGMAPPPYRIQLSTVVAEVNAQLARKPLIPKEALGDAGSAPAPKPWSQVIRDMFPEGRKGHHR
jgi:hypothetical protein